MAAVVITVGEGCAGPAARPAEDSADAGFARDMAIHHQQAVEMSFIVRDRTSDENVRRLAYDIANTQANQRGMLLGWLDLWELPKTSRNAPMAWMASGGQGHDGHGTADGHEAGDGSLMLGMATKTELAALAKADGRQAEILYLQLMTDHHKGGVTMAKGCADLCKTGPERKLASGMVDAQQSELTLMADLLKQRGAGPRP
ncbi:DUF305 domain-containing protein [Streptomyces sp. NPDC093595]|uniref:DUF305 domain-containing protein n=1 Tax=Streptomyces sp. NPDC093595 TaxID=3366045 RepID=UPI00381A985A